MSADALTDKQVIEVFARLIGVSARPADLEVVKRLGGTPEVLAEYIWDHWMGEPESPTEGEVLDAARQVLAEGGGSDDA